MNALSGQAAAGEASQDSDAFLRKAAEYRPELLAHCYRMLGSVQDAEDLVQETYLRAWRGYGGFEGRSSLRFWLYRIATSACLTALQHSSRRFVPAGLGTASDDVTTPLHPAGATEIPWVQPMPDLAPDPAAVVAERGSVRLALVVALQELPPRQRAVLILRDVMAWRAAEVADLLGTSPAAVNSALQRARAQLRQAAVTEDEVTDSLDDSGRALVDRYAKAFEDADVDALARLLSDDVRLEMPPEPQWFAGREVVLRFLAARVFPIAGEQRLRGLTVNDGQSALATYWRANDGRFHSHAIQVLTLRGHRVAGILVFREAHFPAFGLPATLDADAPPAPSWPR
ncbi:sigma-70 family RNA polymerase sigma factor [Actinacidiphila paucisporea]|uniref:RNA polymerase, sigma subunit, ECF family n=1 Tax=Actinacidiphila paucisporea TaxID=310782 RepID=A0A1M7ND09_9ACTN|nr:sigma-70 family RNA polymerase sigma factor [Actinacidiphila paucisporea]SHN01530.1 RNA polymerase, sigma subunit, ECF family [Actinacidiphila paucisporea]